MLTEFLEGETYTNPKLDRDIMVLGVGIDNAEEVVLAILWVDRESEESCGHGELAVKRSDFKDWKMVEHTE